MPLADPKKLNDSTTDFSPPRAKLRPVPNPVDPPHLNRERMTYPYGEHFPDDAA